MGAATPRAPHFISEGLPPQKSPGLGGGLLPPGGLGGGNPQELTRAQGAPRPGGGHTRPSEDFPEASGAAATPRAPHFISEGLPPQKSLPVGGGGGGVAAGGSGRGKSPRTDPGPGGPGAPGRSPKAIRGLSRGIRGRCHPQSLHFISEGLPHSSGWGGGCCHRGISGSETFKN